MGKEKSTFIIDIHRKEENSMVTITGHILDKKDYNNGFYGIKIRDITGSIWCNTDKIEFYNSVKKNGIVNIYGDLITNQRNTRVIRVTDVDILTSVNTKFSLLDSEIFEQSAKMLMNRILRVTSSLLDKQGYIEFESKLISRQLPEDNSLEPLLVKYSGFGTPVCLTISPSAQVIEFLETTLSKCFTISTSFTQSYRLPGTSSELKVLMAKSLSLSEDGQKEIMKDIVQKIYSEIVKTDTPFILKEYTCIWPDQIEPHILNGDINLICFNSDIPVIGKRWNSVIKKIFHILDKERNILIEGACERVSDEVTISTITIYPSQFLNLIKNAPARQIKNLDKLFYGKN